MTDIIKVGLTSREVEEATPEEALERLQARLRKLAMKINETPDGPEKAELKKKHRELLQRIREFGDADLKDSYPGDDLSEEAAVNDIVADFAPALDGGNAHDAVDLSEGERPPADRPDEGTGRFLGAEEFMKMAQEPDAPPSDDQELHDALRAQAEADGFGDDPPDATDDALWDALKDSWGIEEGSR